MAITKKTIYKWFAALLLVFFAFELFWVATQSSPTPTPTPTPNATTGNGDTFGGYGPSTARAVRFGSELLVDCVNATRDTVAAIRAVPGVSLALLSPKGDIISVRVNSTDNETTFHRITEQVQVALYDFCDPRVYRSAELALDNPVNLTNPTTNESRVFTPRVMTRLFQEGGFNKAQGYFNIQTQLNESVTVMVLVKQQPPEAPFVFIQEETPVFEPLEPRTATAEVKVQRIADSLVGHTNIGWESRAYSIAGVEKKVDDALPGANLTISPITRNTIVYLIDNNETGWNQTRAALDNLTFARNTNARVDSITVFVDANYTNRLEAFAQMMARVPNANSTRIVFPLSELTFNLNMTNATSFQGARAAITANVPGELTAFKRLATLWFTDLTKARQDLGIGRLPESFYGYVLGNTTVNQTINVTVVASARGRKLVGLRGEQIG